VTVNGFTPGLDQIALSGYGVDAQTVLAGAQVTAAGTALSLSDGSQIFLAGVTTPLDPTSLLSS